MCFIAFIRRLFSLKSLFPVSFLVSFLESTNGCRRFVSPRPRREDYVGIIQNGAVALPWVPEVFSSLTSGGRRNERLFARVTVENISCNWKPRTKSLWHPGYRCAVAPSQDTDDKGKQASIFYSRPHI